VTAAAATECGIIFAGNSKPLQLYLSISKRARRGVLNNVWAESKGIAGIIAWNASGNTLSGDAIGPMGSRNGFCTPAQKIAWETAFVDLRRPSAAGASRFLRSP
jgi:hypothetical protein